MIELTDFNIDIPGVYLLINDIELIYIGKTKHLKNRLKEHKNGSWFYEKREFNRVFFEHIDNEKDRRLFEKQLLSESYPKLNCNHFENTLNNVSDEFMIKDYEKVNW